MDTIIERYRRRESSVEEALIEMYLAGVSVRRVEDITQALWGSRVSASTVSELKGIRSLQQAPGAEKCQPWFTKCGEEPKPKCENHGCRLLNIAHLLDQLDHVLY